MSAFDIQPPSMVMGNPWQNQYSPNLAGNMPYGIGGLMSMMFGQQLWPVINGGTPQSQFEAAWKRNHSLEMLQMARTTFMNASPFKNLGGMNPNSALSQVAAMMLSQPDGMAANIMAPLLGGNPIAAQMSSLANLQGVGASGLGTLSGVSIGQLNTQREIADSFFYNHRAPIDRASSDSYRNTIMQGMRQSSVLAGSPAESSDLFNSGNELNQGSSAYNRIYKAQEAAQSIDKALTSGKYSSADEVLKTLNKADMGDTMYNTFSEQVKKGFADKISGAGKTFNESWSDAGVGGVIGGDIKTRAISDWTHGINADKIMENIQKQGQVMGMKSEDIKKLVDGFEKGGEKIGKGVNEAVQTGINRVAIDKTVGAAGSINNMVAGKLLSRGINFDNTYGFNYEDLSGARDSAIKNRMVGGNLSNLTKLFYGGDANHSVTSALDAARSAFGNNLTGQQLMNKMSEFVGYSDVQLDKPGMAANFENVLRMLKSTAREANMDPDALMNLTGQAQAFGSMRPATAKLGGMEIAPMITAEAAKIAAIATQMSSSNVRWNGGTEGMLANRVQGSMESMTQPITTQVSAMRTYFKARGDNASVQKVDNYISNGNFTQAGYMGFLQSLPANTGVLLQYANSNVNAQQSGFRDLAASDPAKYAQLQNLGSRAKVQESFKALAMWYGGNTPAAAQAMHKMMGYLAKADTNGLMNDPGLNVGNLAPVWHDLVSKGDFDETMVNMPGTGMHDEHVRLQAASKSGAALEAQLASSMSKMNAPLMTRLVQAMTTAGSGGLSSLLDAIGVSETGAQGFAITQHRKIVQQIKGSQTLNDLAINAHSQMSPDKFSDFATLASKYGLTGESLKDLKNAGNNKDKIDALITNHDAFKDATPSEVSRLYTEGQEFGDAYSDYSGNFSKDDLQDYFTKKEVNKGVDDFTGEAKTTADVTKYLNDKLTAMASSTGKDSQAAKDILGMAGGEGGLIGALTKFSGEADIEGSEGKYKLGDLHKKVAEEMKKADPTKFAGVDLEGEFTPDQLNDIKTNIGDPLKADHKMKQEYDLYQKYEGDIKDAKNGGPAGTELKSILDKLNSLPDLVKALNSVATNIANMK